MKVPYNFIQPSWNVVFAARGGKIHSFSLQDGSHVSTWKHPDVEKVTAASAAAAAAKVGVEASLSVPTPDCPAFNDEEDGPPAKRQRLEKENKEDGDAMVIDEPQTQAEQESEKKGRRDRRKGKKGQDQGQKANNRGNVFARVPDQAVITLMTTTSNGSHLLAISGHDKSLWIFEHDGKGNLRELSQRYVVFYAPFCKIDLNKRI